MHINQRLTKNNEDSDKPLYLITMLIFPLAVDFAHINFFQIALQLISLKRAHCFCMGVV